MRGRGYPTRQQVIWPSGVVIVSLLLIIVAVTTRSPAAHMLADTTQVGSAE